jgi:hypothetical protein
MPLCVRPAVEQLEARDTPSVPMIDPFGGIAPVPVSEPVPVPVPATVTVAPPLPPAPTKLSVWNRLALEAALNPLLADNPIYKVPLVLPVLPR